MKRSQANTDKLSKQHGDFMRDLHYGQAAAKKCSPVEREEREARLKIIQEKQLRKSRTVIFAEDVRRIKLITLDGMVVLDNWKEIDPREL